MVTKGPRVKARAPVLCCRCTSCGFVPPIPPHFYAGRLRKNGDMLACRAMATQALDAALDRLEQALGRVESAVAQQDTHGSASGEELALLKVRHRRLKDTVAQELRQLDLLLAGLPK